MKKTKQLIKVNVGKDSSYIIVEYGEDYLPLIKETALDVATDWGEYDIEEDINDIYDYTIYSIKEEYHLLDAVTLWYMNYETIIKDKITEVKSNKL